jgi:hypothetical protein
VIQLKASFAEWLSNIDVRILQAGLVVVVLFALLNPMGLSVPITEGARRAYESINSLPAGSIAIFAVSTNPGSAAEHSAMGPAILKHLVRDNVKIAFIPTGSQATAYVAGYVAQAKQLGYKEGMDFVNLPFRAGDEKFVASLASGFKSVYKELPSTPLWDSIKDIKSFSMWIDISGGQSQMWAVAHIGDPNKIPVVSGVNSNMIMNLEQYLKSGQLSGLLGGLAGGAQYEVLSGALGTGVAGMDAQGLGYLWIILLLILGNIGYLTSKKAKAAKGGVAGD